MRVRVNVWNNLGLEVDFSLTDRVSALITNIQEYRMLAREPVQLLDSDAAAHEMLQSISDLNELLRQRGLPMRGPLSLVDDSSEQFVSSAASATALEPLHYECQFEAEHLVVVLKFPIPELRNFADRAHTTPWYIPNLRKDALRFGVTGLCVRTCGTSSESDPPAELEVTVRCSQVTGYIQFPPPEGSRDSLIIKLFHVCGEPVAPTSASNRKRTTTERNAYQQQQPELSMMARSLIDHSTNPSLLARAAGPPSLSVRFAEPPDTLSPALECQICVRPARPAPLIVHPGANVLLSPAGAGSRSRRTTGSYMQQQSPLEQCEDMMHSVCLNESVYFDDPQAASSSFFTASSKPTEKASAEPASPMFDAKTFMPSGAVVRIWLLYCIVCVIPCMYLHF